MGGEISPLRQLASHLASLFLCVAVASTTNDDEDDCGASFVLPFVSTLLLRSTRASNCSAQLLPPYTYLFTFYLFVCCCCCSCFRYFLSPIGPEGLFHSAFIAWLWCCGAGFCVLLYLFCTVVVVVVLLLLRLRGRFDPPNRLPIRMRALVFVWRSLHPPQNLLEKRVVEFVFD